jgi:hypothetical protein
MKTVKILATLAILAGGAANAVTVTFDQQITGPGSPGVGVASISATSGGSTVTATGYYWTNSNVWAPTNVRSMSTLGVGVSAPAPNSITEGTKFEYLLLDFGGGTTTVSELVMAFEANPPASRYFTYLWLSAPPSGTTPNTPLASVWTSPPNAGGGLAPSFYTFDMTTGFVGNGAGNRYLLLGASDHNADPDSAQNSAFRVRSITYTSVPDGGATLAFLGAAFGVLGLATRRRRL